MAAITPNSKDGKTVSYEEAQIQVRGRYRSDLKNLYVLDKAFVDNIEVSEEWLNKPLYKADKDLLCQSLGLKDPQNSRLLKWPTVRIFLEDSGYSVDDVRTNSSRYSIIRK